MNTPQSLSTKHSRLAKITLGMVTAAALCGFLATPAHATNEPDTPPAGMSDSSPNGLYTYHDGEYQLVLPVEMEETSEAKATPQTDNTAFLLDPQQWFQCWAINDAHYLLRTYNHPSDGHISTISLKCGTSAFGYKHIAAGHEKDWQGVLDGVTPPGTTPNVSWDDLMSAGTGNAIRHWEIKINQSGNKTCVIGTMIWFSNGVFSKPFNTRTIWSKNNMHVITSFPDRAGVCPDK